MPDFVANDYDEEGFVAVGYRDSVRLEVIFAVFYWDEAEKKWIGGKMDWCDENRTSRDMENIYDGYNGWKSAGWEAAKKRAFCVVSADGKFRSNVPED